MNSEEMNKEMNAILDDLSKAVKAIGTVQQGIHELIIRASVFSFLHKDKGNELTSKVLNTLVGVKGSFRVESVAYWFTHIAGIEASYSKDKGYSCKLAKDRYLSEKGVSFTYNREHVISIKKEEYKFWKIAPIEIKDLKLPSDIDKTTTSSEVMLARALAGGSIGEQEIKEHLAKMFDRVKQLATSGKTKEWLEDFYLQHPEQRPAMDPIEAEIVEVFREEVRQGILEEAAAE